ncbi:MAG: sulfite exporter TauE/SafE family protein [Flavobacteriales bacterium]
MMIYWAAFSLGILGSFHCIGMCGPIVLSLPASKQGAMQKFNGQLLYHTGRAITYALIGILPGMIGAGFTAFGFQQKLSIILGVLLLFILLAGRLEKFRFGKPSLLSPFTSILRQRLGYFLRSSHPASSFMTGMLNGFLPCGLVYLALASAAATGSVYGSMLFMFIFGMGTLPAMAALGYSANFISIRIRNTIRKAQPFVIAFMALLLIARGLNLGIPYISPKAPETEEELPACCHKPQGLTYQKIR